MFTCQDNTYDHWGTCTEVKRRLFFLTNEYHSATQLKVKKEDV